MGLSDTHRITRSTVTAPQQWRKGGKAFSVSLKLPNTVVAFQKMLHIQFYGSQKRSIFEEGNCTLTVNKNCLTLSYLPAPGEAEETYIVKFDRAGNLLLPDGSLYLKNGQPVSITKARKTFVRVNFWDLIYPETATKEPYKDLGIAEIKPPKALPSVLEQLAASRDIPYKAAVQVAIPKDGRLTVNFAVKKGEKETRKSVLLYHETLRTQLAGKKALLAVVYDAKKDPMVFIYDSAKATEPSCILFWDHGSQCFYFRSKNLKGSDQDIRSYPLLFSDSDVIQIGSLTVCRAHEHMGKIVLLRTADGKWDNCYSLPDYKPHSPVLLYDRQKEVTVVLLGAAKVRNPAVLKSVSGYAHYCAGTTKAGGKTYRVLEAPTNINLLDKDMEALGLTDATLAQGAWAYVEHGVVTAIYSNSDIRFEHPIRPRVIRDENWAPEASSREAIREAATTGIKIYEGWESKIFVDQTRPNSSPIEFINTQGKRHQIASYEREGFEEKQVAPTPVSIVAVDNQQVLFCIRETHFDAVTRQIADLVILAYKAGFFSPAIRSLAEKAYAEYREKGPEAAAAQIALFREKVVSRIEKKTAKTVPQSGYEHCRVVISTNTQRGTPLYSVATATKEVYIAAEDLIRLGLTPENTEAGCLVYYEKGIPLRLYAHTDAAHEKPIYLKVVRGRDWSPRCSTRYTFRVADIDGIKIVEGLYIKLNH